MSIHFIKSLHAIVKISQAHVGLLRPLPAVIR